MNTKQTNQDLKIALHIESIRNDALPAEYRPSSSEVALQDARQSYYARVDTELSYDQIVKAYQEHSSHSQQSDSRSPTGFLQPGHQLIITPRKMGDALVEYRERLGLDQLREKILSELVKAASFEAGIEFLADYIRNDKPPLATRLLKGKEELSAQKQVEIAYPDLNADEVSWLALIGNFSNTNVPWIGDVPHHQFYPPSLIGMDPSGLVFANNAEDIEDHGRITPNSVEELTGVTGHDRNVYHYRFRHNVAEGIKALITLSLNETDIFEQLRNDEAIMAMRQGDSLLVDAFVKLNAQKYGIAPSELHRKVSELVDAPNNSLTKTDVQSIRHEAVDYLLGCRFYDTKGHQQILPEVVKLLGLTERLPDFILKREPFQGSVLFYSGSLQFIDLEGRIVDSIPLVEHLRNRFGYKLRDQVDEVDLRTKVTRALFTEISERIRETNIENDNATELDRLQEEILLQYNITVPIHSTWKLETIRSFGKLYTSQSANDSQFRRFLKFGAFELRQLNTMLNELPSLFTREVSSLRKGSVVFATESILTTGQLLQGCYIRSSKAVVINVPEFGPQTGIDYLEQLVDYTLRKHQGDDPLNKIEKDESILLKLQHDFFHTVIHEFAESVAALGGLDLIVKWSEIDLTASKAARKKPRTMYVSSYAATDPKEDFCECCAVYFLAGETFRRMAAQSPVLAKKYEFMRRLFSHDNTPREYPDRYPHHLYDIVGDPALPREDIHQEHFAVQFQASESRRERDLRDRFSSSLVSFEDVADVINGLERKGMTTTREAAAEMALQKQRELHESEDEVRDNQRMFLFVHDKVLSVAQEYKVACASVEAKIFEVLDAIYNGDSKALRNLLITTRDKKISSETAQEMIRRLRPLVKAHSQAIDGWRMRYDEEPDLNPGILGNMFSAIAADLKRET